jgi:hypothetical protein
MKKYIEYIKEDNINLLYCQFNELKQLPKLPESLQVLHCNDNKLTELPKLPDSLQDLYCDCNPLKCLIPSKFIKYQTVDWLEEHYYPMINSYDGQKNILEQDESNIKELLKQTKGNINPKIKEEYNHLFQANDWGLI